jgi:hypothetical protein
MTTLEEKKEPQTWCSNVMISGATLVFVLAGVMLFLSPSSANTLWYENHHQRHTNDELLTDPPDLHFPPASSVNGTVVGPGMPPAASPSGSYDDTSASPSASGGSPLVSDDVSPQGVPPESSDPPFHKFYSDECDVERLRTIVTFDNASRKWVWADREWCGMKLPLSGADLRQRLAGKRILFLGDSVVRNSFVMTMAKMCNEVHMDRCMTRMPTYEYDLENAANRSGPMGCVPGAIAKGTRSPCFMNGTFSDVGMKGLSTKQPRDRAARKTFLQKGLIGHAMHMKWQDTQLIYVPVTRPKQIARVARWMRGKRGASSRYLHADYTVISIGPHLKQAEVEYTPLTLNVSLHEFRSSRGPRAPIVAAEFVHAVNSMAPWVEKVDRLMSRLRRLFTQHEVALVPQRHITSKPYVLKSSRIDESDRQLPPPRYSSGQCGYYDAQHPAFRCQTVSTELLVAAVIGLGSERAQP